MLIPVVLKDGSEELVDKDLFHSLMKARHVVFFRRSGGWVTVGRDSTRDMLKRAVISIPERRKTS